MRQLHRRAPPMFFPGSTEAARRRAFTLIELLTVIVIVALLAGIALGGVRGMKDRAASQRARIELATLANALEAYRRHYGDYPQTGGFAQAEVRVEDRVSISSVQARLFNALTGASGPGDLAAPMSGPLFLEIEKFQLEDTTILASSTWGVAVGSPPRKPAVANTLLDPWGRRYVYYYRSEQSPEAWKARSYVLYSTGPDGEHVSPDPTTGLYLAGLKTAGVNADNVDVDFPL